MLCIDLVTLVTLCFSAPYEICPEDYAVSMVWRRTPSGELAFNRCPPNATGKEKSESVLILDDCWISCMLLICMIWSQSLAVIYLKYDIFSVKGCLNHSDLPSSVCHFKVVALSHLWCQQIIPCNFSQVTLYHCFNTHHNVTNFEGYIMNELPFSIEVTQHAFRFWNSLPGITLHWGHYHETT